MGPCIKAHHRVKQFMTKNNANRLKLGEAIMCIVLVAGMNVGHIVLAFFMRNDQ